MTNQIDNTPEIIDSEFTAAAEELGIEDVNQPEELTGNASSEPVIDEAQQQAEIEAAKMVIASSLRFTVSGIVKVDIDDSHYDNTAEAYAVLIIKYFPGGLFALLDKYKEELAAGTMTILLIKAVREAKAVKEQEEDKPEDSNKTDNEPEADHATAQ